MTRSILIALIFTLFGTIYNPENQLSAQTLKLKYGLTKDVAGSTTVMDESGNGYDGTLKNGAVVTTFNKINVIDLGANNGYVDLLAKTGGLISTLDNFSIVTTLYIPADVTITGNGNFIWNFSNSSNLLSKALGGLFFTAKNTRYAITKTNYTGESNVSYGTALTKGDWRTIIYSQINGLGKIYVNGKLLSSGNITINPSALGSTSYNYIGRSGYSADAYLKSAKIAGFSIYQGALTDVDITNISNTYSYLNDSIDRIKVDQAFNSLVIPNSDSITSSLSLLKNVNDGVIVSWTSSNPAVINNDGVVFRPSYGESAISVELVAKLTYNNISKTKTFNVNVLPMFSDKESVDRDLSGLFLKGNINNLRSNLQLPTSTSEGSKVIWTSNSTDFITSTGRLLKLSPVGNGKKVVVLTAKLTKGEYSSTKSFNVSVAEDEGTSSYLFVYFTGNAQVDEQIKFALGTDGYTYTPLNNGAPVIGSDSISIKKAVRDPHILRGIDGKTFYMVATDMRSSEGWSSNRGIVMLKSTDLIHWQHATVNFPTRWPDKWAGVTRVWAPQTIYDKQTGKYLIYFSLLTSDGTVTYDKVFYCYANSTFTDLETAPELLFDRGSSTIDGDIVYNEVDSMYHMFYKNESGGGISKVVSKTLTAQNGNAPSSQWSVPYGPLQQTTQAVEGVGVFKLINSDNWMMMYDCYSNGHYQYCSTPDLFKFTYVADNYNISARHGTTMAISATEAQRLVAAFPSSALTNTPLGASNINIRQDMVSIDNTAKTINLPVFNGTDLTKFDPQLFANPGTVITPAGTSDFTRGKVNYIFKQNGISTTYQVGVSVEANPVLPAFHADPDVLYSEKTGKFYIYPTTDGYAGWGGYFIDVFSSPDLVNWTKESTAVDFSTGQVSWATGNAWAPCIEEKKLANNSYRYFLYFSGESGGKKIGVAVANDPTGPFVDSGKPLVGSLPAGVSGGQQIDVDIFTDPVSGKHYLYYGNGYMAVTELNEDMVSLKDSTTKVLTPSGGTLSTYAYREAPYVFYKNGLYYFLWSVDDTGAANYHVAYGTSTSPTGPINVAAQPIVIIQDAANQIYGTGHNSILKIPGKDEWYIVYHRINKNYLTNGPGIHREVCIDKIEFNTDGTIKLVTPTKTGIQPVTIPDIKTNLLSPKSNKKITCGKIVCQQVFNFSGQYIGPDTQTLKAGIYIVRTIYDNGTAEAQKVFVKS